MKVVSYVIPFLSTIFGSLAIFSSSVQILKYTGRKNLAGTSNTQIMPIWKKILLKKSVFGIVAALLS